MCMIQMIRMGGIVNNLATQLVPNSTYCGLDGDNWRIGGEIEREEFDCWT